MEFYLFFGLLIAIISSYPFVRLFFKRLYLYIGLKRNENYILETDFFRFFSPLRISEGFTLTGKSNGKRIKVYTVSAYNRRETLEFTNEEFCVKKLLLIMGGRVGASASFSWYTPLRNLPEYLKTKEEDSFILLSPAPLAVRYNGNEIYLGDKMLGKELINATKIINL